MFGQNTLNSTIDDRGNMLDTWTNAPDHIKRIIDDLVNRWAIKHDPTGIAGLDANEPMLVLFMRASEAHDNHKWLLQQINK